MGGLTTSTMDLLRPVGGLRTSTLNLFHTLLLMLHNFYSTGFSLLFIWVFLLRETLRYEPERRGFDSPWRYYIFH
jgi:hypothetical protein